LKPRGLENGSFLHLTPRAQVADLSQTIALPSGYDPVLADLKARLRAAQVPAVLSVNRGNENGPG